MASAVDLVAWGSEVPDRPEAQVLRRALRHRAFVLPRVGGPEMPGEDRLVLAWVAKASRPLVDLHDPVPAREVLESQRRRIDGGEASVETMRRKRKRKVPVYALHFAVPLQRLSPHHGAPCPKAGRSAGRG